MMDKIYKMQEANMEQKNTTAIIRKLYLSLFPIQALAAGLPFINSLLSTCLIGNLIGPTALAAIGFTSPLNSAVVAISSMVAIGSQLLCGQSLGKGDQAGMRRTFTCAVLVCIVIGLFFTAAYLLFPVPIAHLLGSSADTLAMTADYIRGMSFGMVFSVLSACLLPFLQLDQKGGLSSVSVVLMACVNVVGNLLNALVFHGGMFGAGLSTSLANILSVLVCLPHFLLHSKAFRFTLSEFNFRTVRSIFYQGLPSAVTPACNVIRERLLNQFIFALGGTVAMSAFAVTINLANSIGCTLEGGFNGSNSLLASVLVGERDSSSLRDLPRISIRASYWMYTVAYAALFFLAKPLCLLFGAEPEFISVYTMVLRLYCLWFLTNAFKTYPVCIYRAMGKVTLTSLFFVWNSLITPIICCFLLSPAFGLPVVVGSPVICEIFTILAYAVYFTGKAKRLPRSPLELAYIPSNAVSAPRENRFKATLRTVEEAVAVSQQAIEFCRSKGLSSKTAYYCGLCLEEMMVDTITNGFTRGKRKDYTIDLRMICEDGGISVLLRDNSQHFDPTEWLALYAPEDPSRSVGIRMVSKLAKEMNYTSALGLNVLTIKL